ncbi:MAG: 16, gp15 [Streptosporangiaceae bacterium]|nr:16, gp15 [Streptosporangiaceae bacterium]
MERYGEAIEADLHHYYGVDLLDVWRDEISPRKVLNLVDRLPSTSQYIAAIANDDEHAANVDLNAAPAPPSLTEWSPVVAGLAVVADRLGTLIGVQVARGGGSPPKLTPYPRPVTAAHRRKERRLLENHKALVARLLPDK